MCQTAPGPQGREESRSGSGPFPRELIIRPQPINSVGQAFQPDRNRRTLRMRLRLKMVNTRHVEISKSYEKRCCKVFSFTRFLVTRVRRESLTDFGRIVISIVAARSLPTSARKIIHVSREAARFAPHSPSTRARGSGGVGLAERS